MSKRNSKNSLSTLAETADEYIKLECARRRNQPLARRRSMLQEQFQVAAPVSRLKERVAQTRHHEFLVRTENRAALESIIDSVREVVEGVAGSETRSGSDGDRRRSSAASLTGLNPMECARLQAWTADTERVLTEFEPSDSHENDPIVRVVEQLQQLQDGPVCLAEAVVDARALLERWERAGVFDDPVDDDNSDSNSDNEGERATMNSRSTRPLDRSYAYQNVRQRAAANCIKRNVLRWVRSKESFCQRVSEIELFGRTTESLLKELTSTSGTAAAAAMAGDAPQDIFSVMRGRRVDRFANSIALADLMHFAKHVAIFPVDQALRSLDVMARRRRLLDLRSAIKIQWTWRKARSIFQARRMFHAMEQVRIEREREAAALAEALALVKAQTPQKNGKRKSTKPVSKKIRDSIALQSLLGGSTRGSEENDEAKERSGSISAAMTSRVRASMMVSKRKESKVASDAKEASKSLNGTPTNGSRRQRAGGNDAGEAKQAEEEPEDTSDVVNAWQAFLDSTKLQEEIGEAKTEEDTSAATSNPDEQVDQPISEPISEEIAPEESFVLPSMDENDWRDWSDDEDGALATRDFGAHTDSEKRPPPSFDRPTTRNNSRDSVPSRSTSRESSSRESNATEIGAPRRRLTKQPTALAERRTPRDFGSIVSTADLIKRLEQRPRLDRPSVLVPFADWGTSISSADKSSALADASISASDWNSVRSPRHLHEMDYHHLYPGVEELHALRSLLDASSEGFADEAESVVRQQQQEMRVLPSPPSAGHVNRMYRSSQLHQPSRTVVAKNNTNNVADTVGTVATSQRAPNRPGIRIYRAAASQTQREFVVVKRPPAPGSDEEATVQQQLSAHAEWMRTLDSHDSFVIDLPSSGPAPTHQGASLRSKMPRKRRQRAQEGKPVHHDTATGVKLNRNDSESRPQPSPPSALPYLQPTSSLTAPLTSDPPAENRASPSRDAQESPPKPQMGEIRRSLRFKNIEAPSSTTPPSSARDLASKIEPSRSLDKASYTKQPKTTTIAEGKEPEQLGLDGRFDTSATAYAAFRATRKRKWRLSKRLPAAHSTGYGHESSRPTAEDTLGRRMDSPRVEHDVQVDEKRRQLTPRRDESFPGSRQVFQATSGEPMRPISSSRSKGTTDGLGPPQPALAAPPPVIQQVTTDRRAGSLRETRALRQLQVQAAEVGGSTGPGSGVPPLTIELVPLPPAVASDPARSVAFNRLLQQYLGLLQCPPTRPHHVADMAP